MMKKNYLISYLSVTFIVLVVFLSLQKGEPNKFVSGEYVLYGEFIDTTKFFDTGLFYGGLGVAAGTAEFNFFSMVVPHHTLPADLLSGAFMKAQKLNPMTIIVVGPDHFAKAESVFTTTEIAWGTPFGFIEADSDVIQNLKSEDLSISNELFYNEHSIGALIPYISYYLPEAKVVPILISPYAKLEEIEKLANQLVVYSNSETLLISSVDFSHYLTPESATINDMETKKLIEQEDYRQLMTLSSDNLDSPGSVILAMLYSKQRGSRQIYFDKHSNSSIYLEDNTVPVTSYYTLYF